MSADDAKEDQGPPSLESHRRSGSWLDMVKTWSAGDQHSVHSLDSKGKLDANPEDEALELLKERISEAGSEHAEWLEAAREDKLRRVLRARRLDVDKAFANWERLAQWRAAYKPDKLTAEDAEWYMSQKALVRQGKDRRGRPSSYIQAKFHTPNAARIQDIIKAVVYAYESDTTSSPDGYCSVVFDTEGCGYRQVDPKLWLGKEGIVHLLQDFYPESLGGCLIINASWFFKIMWKLLTPFLDEVTVAKVKVLDSPNDVLKYYEYDELAEPLKAQVQQP